MRIGVVVITARDLNKLSNDVQALEARGFHTAWLANIIGVGFDALAAMTVLARETGSIELGTAVVPIFLHHPLALAQQALTIQSAACGRLTLGVGLSHPDTVENTLGLSYAKPRSRMHEYLSVLGPLLAAEQVHFGGKRYRVKGKIKFQGAMPTPLLVAALGPRMLETAGRLADGTIVWMTGPRTLETHTIPRITEAAKEASRPEPRIVAGFPMALTNDPDGARAAADNMFSVYGELPSYRAMLDREGAAGPGDNALVGDEAALDAELKRLADMGVTDLFVAPFPSDKDAPARTLDFLASRL